MLIPYNYTISPSSQIGEVYGTDFVFNATISKEFTNLFWNFGDGNGAYNNRTVKHSYNYPGVYTVTLSAWTDYNQMFIDVAEIRVDYKYRDLLVFEKNPELFNYPGVIPTQPFVLSLTSSRVDEPLAAIIQVHGTESLPFYAVPQKWNFIVPSWKILDENFNVIKDNVLHFKQEPIYNSESKIVGTKGKASFYYVDDLSNEFISSETCPILITATLSTLHFSYPPESRIYPYPGFSNNQTVIAVKPWLVYMTAPTELKITENYINEVYSVKWINVPIPITISTVCDLDRLDIPFDLNMTTKQTKCLNWPPSNELGNLHTVEVSMSASNGIPLVRGVHYETNPNINFRKRDNKENLDGGYVFTTITPLSNLLTANPEGTFVITASTVVQTEAVVDNTTFTFPRAYPIRNKIYISHPNEGVFNKIVVESYPEYCREASYYNKNGYINAETSNTQFNVPITVTDDISYETVSGTNDIYGIAYNPIQDTVFALDAFENTILKYNTDNVLLTSVQLESILARQNLTPCYASIDKQSNVWISLYDDFRLLKFNSNLTYILSTAVFDSNKEIQLLSPPVVETDRLGNVWACWAHTTSSCLVKFDRYGAELLRAASLPGNSDPTSLAITPQNGVWVSCFELNSLFLYSDTGELIESVPGILKPTYIALDRSANVWIAHGYNLCSKYDTTNKTLSTWKFTFWEEVSAADRRNFVVSNLEENIDTKYDVVVPKLSSKYITEYSEEDIKLTTSFDEIWGGMSIDVYDRLWIINSEKNILGKFEVYDPTLCTASFVEPRIEDKPIIKPGDAFSSRVTATRTRSAQAAGDWTGNKWYQKHVDFDQIYPIRGNSVNFKLYDTNKDFNLLKINENFDYANYCKSLAFPTPLQNNPAIFDEFIKSAVGTIGDGVGESPTGIVYEKIANFVMNHADIDTAEIPGLISLANQMGVEFNVLGSNFPAAVDKLINLFSIEKRHLRGVYKPDYINNFVLDLLSTSDLLSSGTYYVFENMFNAEKYLIYLEQQNNKDVFTISDIVQESFTKPIHLNYNVYKIANLDKATINNYIIDWNSAATTVPYSLSTDAEWYGDGGVVESCFNKLLTKQLYLQ